MEKTLSRRESRLGGHFILYHQRHDWNNRLLLLLFSITDITPKENPNLFMVFGVLVPISLLIDVQLCNESGLLNSANDNYETHEKPAFIY